MPTTITMADTGRIVLPKNIRDRLQLRGGARLKAEVVADRIELTPEADETLQVVRKGKRWVLTGMSAFEAGPAVKEARVDRDAQIARRLRGK